MQAPHPPCSKAKASAYLPAAASGLVFRLQHVCWAVRLACLHCRHNSSSSSLTHHHAFISGLGALASEGLRDSLSFTSAEAQGPQTLQLSWHPICHHRVKLLLWFLHNHIWSPLNTSPCCQMGSWGIDPFLAVGVSLPLGVSGDSMGNLGIYSYLVAMRCPSSSWLWLPEETKWTGRIFTTTWFNKARKITRDRRGCYVTMKNSVYQEGTAILNVYA